ncbi:OmpA family protein [Ekhidna sp.]|uniref:OmpA family protein n=1 Tax=Ekhidna sp. TaxID=2608089 RepID=UPI0032997413
MRKLLSIIVLLASCYLVVGQSADNRIAFPLGLTLNHFEGKQEGEIFKLNEASLGVETGVKYYLSKSFNLAGNLHFFKLDGENFEINTQDYDLALEYKLNNGLIMSEDAKLKPYLTAGFGLLHNSDTDIDKNLGVIPVGAGLRYELSDNVDFQIQSRYKITPKDEAFDYLTTSLGLVFTPGGKKDSDGDGVIDKLDKCPSQAGGMATNGCPDSDKDGVADKEDNCPRIAGVAQFMGCPDSDGDGIVDTQDSCPNEAGSKENNGCPDSDGDGIIDRDDACPDVAGISNMNGCPDSDGDGVADKDDRCPQVKGLRANSGCPEKDTDSDGVIDKEDDCPETAGPTSNNGCPEINDEVREVLREALEGVQFRSGSDVLLGSSNAKLDKVVQVLKGNLTFNLKISGYTDNTGNEQANLVLSQKRAHAAEKYLVDNGIDASRIEAEGYGIANPVADNGTREGRAKNRRVEFEIVFK